MADAHLYTWSVASIRIAENDGEVHASGATRALDRAIVQMSKALADAPSGAVGIIAVVPMNTYIPTDQAADLVAMATYDGDTHRVDLVEI